MFFLILSQPKLTNIGVIDYRPAKWSRLSAGATADSIESAVAELEERRFVVVDRDTEELLVRTFVKNDGMCQRWQMVSAMWSAWELVESRALRRYVLDWLPDEAWTSSKAAPPKEAEQLRHSDPIPIGIATRLASDCDPIETPNSLLLSPSPTPSPTPASAAIVIAEPDAFSFDEFWAIYPARNGKKVEKSKARAGWSRLSLAKRRQAMVGVQHYRCACDMGMTLAKDAFRWLSGECWGDWQEPPEPIRHQSQRIVANEASERRVLDAVFRVVER